MSSHISLTKWEELLTRYLRILMRKFSSAPDKEDKKFKEAFSLLYDFDKWLANKLYVGKVRWATIENRLKEIFEKCRKSDNSEAGFLFLTILQDIREEYDAGRELILGDASNFIKDGKLYYCGLEMEVKDDEAIYTDEKGKEHEFPIEWDWWFNIEDYCYLEKGWKE